MGNSLIEERAKNERLRKEGEVCMFRSLQAASTVLADKAAALDEENAVLHAEVEQLTEEIEVRGQEVDAERIRTRSTIERLQEELRSLAIGYEQVERGYLEQNREVQELQAAASSAWPDPERARAEAVRQTQEFEQQKAVLLEVLGRVLATCPAAQA